MGRFKQSRSAKGSQKWLQTLINEKPDILNRQLRTKLGISEEEKIEWLSPVEADEYAEYRDEAFVERLGITLELFPLKGFWPSGGPQWDGLGKSRFGKLLLVEAKSHIPELMSTFKSARTASIDKIFSSLEETKNRFGVKADYDWSKPFYQYANRLAHVHLLRENQLEAWLVNLYFVNDVEMEGPRTADEWKGAIRLLHRCLGLREHLLQKWIVDAFVNIANLTQR